MSPNLAASVRGRLTNLAKAKGRPFQEVLQHYGLERLLFRLAESPHGGRFLLKGALLMTAWGAPVTRPTRDIDLLGYGASDVALLAATFGSVCELEVPDDGLRFDAGTIVADRIKKDAEYEGIRLTFTAYLEKARIPIQVDIGFGDVVHPEAEERDYPAMLDFPTARLRMYPRETVVAEKFEALVQRGSLNTRMKDFFDLWLLATTFEFDGPQLATAVSKTFENRGTALEVEPVGLTLAHATLESSQKQWSAFVNRSQLHPAPKTLAETCEQLRPFLLPVATAIVNEQAFTGRWVGSGPWGPAS